MAIRLSPRLASAAEMCGRCGTVADVGCDHGRLGAYLLKEGLARRALFCDISALSLSKAEKLVRVTGMEARAAFYVSDGFRDIPEPFDKAVVAGLGGGVICSMLESGAPLHGASLVLSPNCDAPGVRRALCRRGYAIDRERLVRDAGRLYILIGARAGFAPLTAREEEAGPCLLREMPPEMEEYAAFMRRVLMRALEGAKRGGDAERERAISQRLSVWEELA